MTTIAWDGEVLAADTQATKNYGAKRIAHKIHVLENGDVFAGTGEFSDTILVRDWLRKPDVAPPTLSDDGRGTNGLLWVAANRKMYTLDGPSLTRHEVHEAYYAVGSGAEYAQSAMALGLSATEAVVHASKFDAFTNDIVDAMPLVPVNP